MEFRKINGSPGHSMVAARSFRSWLPVLVVDRHFRSWLPVLVIIRYLRSWFPVLVVPRYFRSWLPVFFFLVLPIRQQAQTIAIEIELPPRFLMRFVTVNTRINDFSPMAPGAQVQYSWMVISSDENVEVIVQLKPCLDDHKHEKNTRSTSRVFQVDRCNGRTEAVYVNAGSLMPDAARPFSGSKAVFVMEGTHRDKNDSRLYHSWIGIPESEEGRMIIEYN